MHLLSKDLHCVSCLQLTSASTSTAHLWELIHSSYLHFHPQLIFVPSSTVHLGIPCPQLTLVSLTSAHLGNPDFSSPWRPCPQHTLATLNSAHLGVPVHRSPWCPHLHLTLPSPFTANLAIPIHSSPCRHLGVTILSSPWRSSSISHLCPLLHITSAPPVHSSPHPQLPSCTLGSPIALTLAPSPYLFPALTSAPSTTPSPQFSSHHPSAPFANINSFSSCTLPLALPHPTTTTTALSYLWRCKPLFNSPCVRLYYAATGAGFYSTFYILQHSSILPALPAAV